jgi:hypothetical protein
MKFDDVGRLEQVIWNMRLADLPRGQNRAILNKLFNGGAPFDESKAEENSIQVNRNFLEGPNILSQGRSQWNNAMLKQANYFGVQLDSGAPHKRQEWGNIITRNINRQLKRCRGQMEQIRAEGANVLLHGLAPSCFKDRRYPILSPLPVSSLMIPSETDIDFENLEYFGVFREWTPFQLYTMTHGPKVDPGWNMKAVRAQLEYMATQYQKEINSTAYQYMPERIEELIKQDGGFWGSDAVPTVDVWDCYFRETEDGNGWYRRIFLDWEVSDTEMENYTNHRGEPKSQNDSGFLYTSGKRKYADALGEILQCQFGDCSAVAPFKYHSVRSLGWMIWGVCDIQNRLRCKFTESVFEQLMWFFRVASQQDFQRIKKAMFTHMGVIPSGVSFVTANDRFKPDSALVEMAIAQNRQTMGESASTFTQDFDQGKDNEMTATETMARVHKSSALLGGMLTLAYEYSKYKYREQSRRFCIKNSPYKMVRDFRLACLKDGVPAEMLNADRWDIEPDKALGDGNKILEMAIVQFLQGIRKNLGPDAQRKVDHMSIVSATDQPALAEDLAPIDGQKRLSPSVHDAQLATERILRGLKYTPSPEMVPEDYVTVWLGDLGALIQQAQQAGHVSTPDEIRGMANLGQHVTEFLKLMSASDEDKPKVKQFGEILGKLMNFVKAFAQRAQKQAGQQNGQAGIDPKAAAQLKGKMLIDQAKAQNLVQSHAMRTAQKQAQFELDQQRKDKELNQRLRREGQQHGLDLAAERAKTVQDLHHNRLRSLMEMTNDNKTDSSQSA